MRGAPLPGDTLGPLSFLRSGFVNIGSQETSGIDVAGYYNLPVGDASLTLGLDWSHLLKFDKILLGEDGLTFQTQKFAGEYEYPDDRIALTGAYQFGDWGINSRVNYISSFKDFRNLSPTQDIDDPPDGIPDGVQPVRSVSSFTTVNFQFTYTGIKNTKLALSIDNAFDEKVPVAIGDGDTDVYGYVSSVHNPRGRFWSIRSTYSF